MKKLIALLTLAAVALHPSAGFAQADIEDDPGYLPIDKVLDLKAIPPQVNVNLPKFLLKDALAGLTSSTNLGGEASELADLVKDVKLIRVVVIEANKTNEAAVSKAMKTLKSNLDSKWTSIVNVSDEGENVGVYVVSDKSGESVAGVAVLVHDGKDAIVANVVGNVSVGKLIKLATQSKMLPKNLLKELQNGNGNGAGNSSGESSDAPPSTHKKKSTGDHGAATNASGESADKAAEN